MFLRFHRNGVYTDDSEAFIKRGNCFKQLKLINLALKDYDKSIEIKPDIEAYINRYNIYAFFGNKEKAQADLKKSWKLIPIFSGMTCRLKYMDISVFHHILRPTIENSFHL